MPARPEAAVVRLRKDLARAIRRGAPWIYRDALLDAPVLPDGCVLTVATRDGRPLASGFWDARSPIAVRLLATPPAADLGAIARARVEQALARRLALFDPAQTDAFRWIHGEADGLPGVHVDRYAGVAVIRFDGAGARTFHHDLAERLIEAGRGLPLRSVVERRAEARSVERRPAALLAGEPPPDEIEVREHGLRFGVDVARGQKGGLFLDQRENRAAIAARCRGKSVLNLFGYTGGFSVHAAAAGASRTVTVDVGSGALEAARRNFERNRLPLDRAEFHAADAFAYLEGAARRGERFDVVISDPPSFAPSRGALPAARRAYARLHRLAAAVVSPGGLLCPASCSSHMPRAEFRRDLADAVASIGRRFTLMEERGAGPDHPVIDAFPEGDYLKLLIGTVNGA